MNGEPRSNAAGPTDRSGDQSSRDVGRKGSAHGGVEVTVGADHQDLESGARSVDGGMHLGRSD